MFDKTKIDLRERKKHYLFIYLFIYSIYCFMIGIQYISSTDVLKKLHVLDTANDDELKISF